MPPTDVYMAQHRQAPLIRRAGGNPLLTIFSQCFLSSLVTLWQYTICLATATVVWYNTVCILFISCLYKEYMECIYLPVYLQYVYTVCTFTKRVLHPDTIYLMACVPCLRCRTCCLLLAFMPRCHSQAEKQMKDRPGTAHPSGKDGQVDEPFSPA